MFTSYSGSGASRVGLACASSLMILPDGRSAACPLALPTTACSRLPSCYGVFGLALSCFFCSSSFCFLICCCLFFSLSFLPPLSPMPAPFSHHASSRPVYERLFGRVQFSTARAG